MITQDKLILSVCDKTRMDYPTVRLIFQAMESSIIELLQKTTEDNPVSIKLFSGLTINGKFCPERVFHTFEDFYCKAKIKVKAKVTDHFNKKINELE